MQQVEEVEPCALAVVEAAILIETGSFRRFDKLVLPFVTRNSRSSGRWRGTEPRGKKCWRGFDARCL